MAFIFGRGIRYHDNTGKMMEFIRIVMHLAIMAHFGYFIWLRIKRVSVLLNFVGEFHRSGVLADKDYLVLRDRYEGVFSKFDSFPDENDYSEMYQDNAFNLFVRTTRSRMRYVMIVIPVLILLIIITSYM